METKDLKAAVAAALCEGPRARGAAVLVPLVDTGEGPAVLLEVRALTLDAQPGEVCLPGGHIEQGETPEEAAVRETCEELMVDAAQIELVGALGNLVGPGGSPLHVLVGMLAGYGGTYSPVEVDRTFALPLGWLLAHDPTWFDVMLEPRHPDDFPWELVPGGRSYPWRAQRSRVPFYLETDPLVWGATARVLAEFSRRLRAAGIMDLTS